MADNANRAITPSKWWVALVVALAATALFVPVRIVYKQNQTHPTKPGAVVIANFAFSPEKLSVVAGTKVTFSNTDGAARLYFEIRSGTSTLPPADWFGI